MSAYGCTPAVARYLADALISRLYYAAAFDAGHPVGVPRDAADARAEAARLSAQAFRMFAP